MTLAPAGADRQGHGVHLLEAVAAACDPAADFPDQLHSTLAAALALLASDPALAHGLCVEPATGDDLSPQGQPRWLVVCAGKLRRAARSCPRADTPPHFLEGFLLGGVHWMVCEYVRTGRGELLPRLMPDLLECTLAYYLDPAEVSRLGAAARDPG